MLSYKENKKLTVINLFGGPCTGKSATAMSLSAKMKIEGYLVDYVPEVAKDMTWERRHHMLTEQDYIFAKQHTRIRRLVGQVDYAVCDSPIILGLMYAPDDFPASFKPFVLDTFSSYNNINILLRRTVQYDPVGRNQTLEEAVEIDRDVEHFLLINNIPFSVLDVDEQIINNIESLLFE
jgi:hypothetical protein